MTRAFHWVTSAFVLLFLVELNNASCLDLIYDQYGDYYDTNLYPPILPLCPNSTDLTNLIPNITIPCLPTPVAPVIPAPPADSNCSVLNPNGSIANGNALFLILDPKSLAVTLKVSAPCNKTDNATTPGTKAAIAGNDDPAIAADPALSDAGVAADPPQNDASEAGDVGEAAGKALNSDADAAGSGSGLVCNLLTLVKTLIDSILKLVLSLLKSLIDTIVNLLKSIVQTVLGKLLPTLINDLGSLLTKLLTDLLETVKKLVDSLLGGILAKDALVSGLLKEVETLLGGLLPVLGPVKLGEVTEQVGTLLNNTLQTILTDVEILVKDLLSPVPTGLVPTLTENIAVLVNNTVQDLLTDVDVLVNDLLTNLLSDSSLVNNLTTDVTKLLNDVLGDTICNVEKLLTDSESLSKLILNLEKLIQDLIDDLLKDVDKLLVDKLTTVLTKQGILDKLLEDILKLLQDLLTNLAFGSKIKNTEIGSNPENFINNILANLTKDLEKILADAVPGSGLTESAGLPPINPLGAVLPAGLLPSVLSLVNTTLTDVVTAVRGLLTSLDTTLVKDGDGLISNLLKSIQLLLDDLLKNLLGDVSKLLGEQLLGNLTNAINPSSLTGPLGTVVTGILKQVLLCNGTCKPTTTTTPKPGGGNDPGDDDNTTTTTTPRIPTIPLPCIPYPINRGCLEDTLFDSVNDPSTFLQRLQVYQAYINQNLYRSLGSGCGSDLADSLLNFNPDCGNTNDNLYPLNLEGLPYRLINGLDGTARLTSNIASEDLFNLVGSLSNGSTT